MSSVIAISALPTIEVNQRNMNRFKDSEDECRTSQPESIPEHQLAILGIVARIVAQPECVWNSVAVLGKRAAVPYVDKTAHRSHIVDLFVFKTGFDEMVRISAWGATELLVPK